MSRNAWIAIVAAEIIAICCCGSILGLFFEGVFDANHAITPPTSIAVATRVPLLATPSLAPVSARANTPVIATQTSFASRTATRAPVAQLPDLYNVIIPTPTAPNLLYRIDFTSTFVVSTYPVTGTTLSAVSKSLEANAISDPHEASNRYYAKTDWYLAGDWSWKQTARGCEVDHGDVAIVMTMTLPALATTNVPRDVSDRWNTFIKNTVTHESGHVKLAQDGARAYQRDLGNLPPAADCRAMQSRLKNLYDSGSNSIDQANVKYDADTRHGVTQGAVFP